MPKRNNQAPGTPIWASQNFLTGRKTIRQLIRKTSICAHDHVIEIGPGKGHITGELLQHCHRGLVSAIELDKCLYERLHAKYSEFNNLALYCKDFLKWTLPLSGDYKVFANIPFFHTTEILRKLTEWKNPPQETWLIMEKGAAKRFMGIPNENIRSLTLKPMYDLQILHYFRREDFHPKPNVDVVMLHMKRKENYDIPPAMRRNYLYFIQNSLTGGKLGLTRLFTKRQLARACKTAGLNDLVSGEILYIQWLCLFRCYSHYN